MSRFAIGVDLGGTNLRVAAINENGGLFDQVNLLTEVEKGREDVVDRLSSGILQLVERWKTFNRWVGLGLGFLELIGLRKVFSWDWLTFRGWKILIFGLKLLDG